jgi:hypothetical protein
MIYGIIVYIGFVLYFGINNYLKKEQFTPMQKGVHLFIGLLLFLYFFLDFRNGILGIYQNGVDSFYTIEIHEKYSKRFDLFTSVIYFINCGFMAGLALNMAVKAKSRELLLYSSPIVVLITSADLYKVVLKNSAIIHADWRLYVFIIIPVGMFFGLVNLYLNTLGKKIFV